jgi:hypothetical protein
MLQVGTSVDVLPGEPLRRSGKPSLDNELFEFVKRDVFEAD